MISALILQLFAKTITILSLNISSACQICLTDIEEKLLQNQTMDKNKTSKM